MGRFSFSGRIIGGEESEVREWKMERESKHLPIQQAVITGGLTASFIREGEEGPTCVVVPGLFQHVNGLRHLITALSKRFDAICLAVPGADGSSPLPSYTLEAVRQWPADVLTALGIHKALFVSVSLGAPLIVPYLAEAEEETAAAYVIQDPVTKVSDTHLWLQLLYHTHRISRKLKLGWLSLSGIWLLRAILAHGLRIGFARALLQMRLKTLTEIGDFLDRSPIRELAAQASERIPTMPVLSGEGTPWLVRAGSIRRMTDSLSSVRTAILHRAGHFLHRRDQKELAKQIVEFAKERGILEAGESA